MADVWKSQGRYFCEICKSWMADNRASRDIHEGGTKHKLAVQQRIKESQEKAREKEKQRLKTESSLAAMEKAALASMKNYGEGIEQGPQLPSFGLRVFDPKKFKDVRSMADEMTRRKREEIEIERQREVNSSAVASAKVKSEQWRQESGKEQTTSGTTVKKKSERLWVEAVTEDGRKYYWHMYSGATVWEAPGSFYTAAEYQTVLDGIEQKNREKLGSKRSADLPSEQPVEKVIKLENEEKRNEEMVESLSIPFPMDSQMDEDIDGIPLPQSIPLPPEPSSDAVNDEDKEKTSVKEEQSDEAECSREKEEKEREEREREEREREEKEREEEEQRAKPSVYGSWTRVKKEDKVSDGISPLTAKYRAEEEKERKEKEERDKYKRPEKKIEFEMKTAAVMTKKKTTVVEFKKKSGPKNVRKREGKVKD